MTEPFVAAQAPGIRTIRQHISFALQHDGLSEPVIDRPRRPSPGTADSPSPPIRTVFRLNCYNRFFAVELKYRGDWLLVSYDPFSRLEEVRLHSLEEQFLQVAPRYERERGSHPYADAASDAGAGDTPLDHEYLKLLQERHQEQLKKEAQRGIDYHAAQRGWSEQLWSDPVYGAENLEVAARPATDHAAHGARPRWQGRGSGGNGPVPLDKSPSRRRSSGPLGPG